MISIASHLRAQMFRLVAEFAQIWVLIKKTRDGFRRMSRAARSVLRKPILKEDSFQKKVWEVKLHAFLFARAVLTMRCYLESNVSNGKRSTSLESHTSRLSELWAALSLHDAWTDCSLRFIFPVKSTRSSKSSDYDPKNKNIILVCMVLYTIPISGKMVF